jgi:lysozyme
LPKPAHLVEQSCWVDVPSWKLVADGTNPATHSQQGGLRLFLERFMSRLTASRAAVDLIASFEGFRARAARTPDGRWTLGFGHVATAREGLTVTRAEAEDLLRWDLRPVEDQIRQSALTPLNQNQFDALVSFAFNIGLSNFATSDVLGYLNQGQPIAAALAMHAWRRARVNGRVLVVDALVRRRAAEAALFLEPHGPRPAAPTSVLRPEIDYAAALLSHASDPRSVALSVAEDGATIETEPLPSSVVTTHGLAANASSRTEASRDISASADTEVMAEALSMPPILTMPLLPDEDSADIKAQPTTEAEESVVVANPLPEAKPIEPIPVFDPVGEPPAPVVANVALQAPPTPANDGVVGQIGGRPAPWNPTNEERATEVRMEAMTVPRKETKFLVTPAQDNRLSWILLGLGGVLLAGGLWFAHLFGVLPPDPEAQKVPLNGIFAVITACCGFVMVVTSAVGLAGGDSRGDEADLMR